MASHLHLASSTPVEELRERDGAAMPAAVRVVLADDHSMVRRGLRQLLDMEEHVQVVGEATDLAAVAQAVRGHRPDVLVLDLGMSDGSGVQAIGRLREVAPQTQIVVLTSEESPVFAQRAFAAGALGFVTKTLADAELGVAILAASRGEQFVSPPVATRLQALQQSLTDKRLTPREVEVLRLIALGHTSVEIARQLRLSPRTIETHRAHICRKLGASSRAELVRYALAKRLIGV